MVPLGEQPRLRAPKPWRRAFETLSIVSSIFLGGVGSGYIFANRQADVRLSENEASHVAELKRLQDAWSTRLGTISDKVGAAADTASSAAETASNAASTASSAASVATTAAISAADVVVKSKAAKSGAAPTQPTQPPKE